MAEASQLQYAAGVCVLVCWLAVFTGFAVYKSECAELPIERKPVT